jgi:dipeptidyl-peptidase-4
MKKIVMMCAVLLAVASQALAGEKLDLKSITGTDYRENTIADVVPLADGESYSALSSDNKQIVKYSFKTGKKEGVIFDVATVRGAHLDEIDGYKMSPDGRNILIQTATNKIYRRSFTAEYYIYNIQNNKMVKLSDNGPQQTPVFSPDGNQIAFVRQNNIYLIKLLYDNSESQVTKDGKFNEIINGIPDWVNEEEFAFNCAMVFTADSKQICWIRYDESKVKQYSFPLFCGQKPSKEEYKLYPGSYTYKYPKAGEDNSKVTVWSFDIKSHQTRQLQVPLDADGYIPRIISTKDPSKVAVYTMNRHQDCLRIYMVNPLSTVAQLVIEDKVNKYIKDDVVNDIQITDHHILLPSERSGYNHLYLYNLNGQLERQITRGNYEVTSVYGYDEATGDTYYGADEISPMDRQVYVAHKNGKTDRITRQNGCNNAIFSQNYQYFINNWSNLNHPSVYTINDNDGKTLVTLEDNQALVDKWSKIETGKREFFQFTTQSGITLNGWMVKPANFDASHHYPVIMYQYGGPGDQQVLDHWGIGMAGRGALLEQYFAQQGYLCVCVDNRGTGGRGAEFEKCTYQQLGLLEAKDQVETALWLGQQSYVDKDHIGIWGWSYGGWNTLMSMSEGRPVFAAGVAIAPPTSWRFYDSVYTERYMRTPNENPNGYDNINPIARVNNLHGALLICHGLADDNVHYQNTAEYTEALVQADKDFSMNVYTNRNHSILGGNTRTHLFRQVTNWFHAHLQ